MNPMTQHPIRISRGGHRLGMMALVYCGALAGCARPVNGAAATSSILTRTLTDGRSVQQLVAGGKPTALLVYTPTICYSCGTPLPLWERAARDGKLRLVLVLTKPPSKAEQEQLILQRVRVAGVLAHSGSEAASASEPSEYVIRSDSIVAQAIGQAQIRGRKLWSSWLPTSS